MSGSPFDALRQAAISGTMSRRELLKRSAALGLGAPAIAALLAACGGSSAPSTTTSGSSTSTTTTATPAAASAATPSATPSASTTTASTGARGGAGLLRLLWWEAPTILNAHLSSGTKDFDASRLCQEPLLDLDQNNNFVPLLAAEVPSLTNGGIASDHSSVTYKLRQGVTWQDGQPFTSADVKFTYDFITNPATGATTLGSYLNVASVDTPDDYTIKVTFKKPTLYWYEPFVGANGYILPQHVLKDYVGAKAHSAPFNLKPVGTGPYKIINFTPGDVGNWALNDTYWQSGKPHFDNVAMKGGGSATSAARAVMQTGEEDWAWNLQIPPTVLKSMGGSNAQGVIFTWPGGGTERIEINFADPQTTTDGQKSYYKTPHPHFKVKAVRQALAYLVDRGTVATTLYGPGGSATPYTLNDNKKYMPAGLSWEYSIAKANSTLDAIPGISKNSSGIRVLNGRAMNWVYSTSVNTVRQQNQEIVKASCAQAGITIQIKSVDASVFFSGDPSNPDTLNRAEYDLGMWTNGAGIYPLDWYKRYLSADPAVDIAQQSNQYSANNVTRYQSAQFNALYAKVAATLDDTTATSLFNQMQTYVVNDIAEIGEVARNNVAAVSSRLDPKTYPEGTFSSSTLWNVADWNLKAGAQKISGT
ncbi:MAG TPA: peptide ABC transporter substrate-binding protein [Thermomicrobiaceae bacterium]|nr:peptide ABC transporter substrate-binding protein [Thermomicrobiaceae bacterium]